MTTDRATDVNHGDFDAMQNLGVCSWVQGGMTPSNQQSRYFIPDSTGSNRIYSDLSVCKYG